MTKPIPDDVVYGRTALREGIPWIVPAAFDKLKEAHKPTWNVFEWGAGGSTLWFARHCGHVISVEHSGDWYTNIFRRLLAEDLLFKKALLIYFRADKDQGKDRFKPYAEMITLFGGTYDLVYVDGEASSRGWCYWNAMDHVEPGGWLMVDNSDWIKQKPIGWEDYTYKAEGLKWIGQPGTFTWYTSLFRRPDE